MKIVYVIMFLILGFAYGCMPIHEPKNIVFDPNKIYSNSSNKKLDLSNYYSGWGEIKEINYDGCEYIYINLGNRSWGAHKGNCKNPIHMYRSEKQ